MEHVFQCLVSAYNNCILDILCLTNGTQKRAQSNNYTVQDTLLPKRTSKNVKQAGMAPHHNLNTSYDYIANFILWHSWTLLAPTSRHLR